WTGNTLPAGIDPNIIFDDNPDRSCFLDQNHSVTDIIINQSTDLLVTNGFNLTIKGSLIFTNGAQIDASAINSNIEFAGTTVQSIPSGAFYIDQVYDLIINNTNNVILTEQLIC
ncbi:MAG: hypothetical protein IPN67_16710, partial [Bacteroidales bacterium]|nr:hypothetical protein [Bacteroidales bacterium]